MAINKFYIELRDDSDRLLRYLHNKVSDLTWQWLRLGGCGTCKFTLRTDFDSSLVSDLKPNYRIYLKSDGVIWWSGYLDKIEPKLTGKKESVVRLFERLKEIESE